MMGKLLRAAGGAASFTLGSLWPMRWPAFPVAFFDFDMFNAAADQLWAETTAKAVQAARERTAHFLTINGEPGELLATLLTSAAEPERPATTLPADPSPAVGPALGSLPPEASAGQPTSVGDCSPAEGFDRANLPNAGGHTPSHLAEVPAGSEFRAHNPAGQPNFTAGELEDAAYAARRHITDRVEPASEIGAEAWTHLAEKLEAAALSK
ncbi:hypothetical protein [Mycobacterium sp. TY813]|uniref:hypothetical protein n=1 Tax=Mycobacterium TaxID=1763 RepID=UPI002740D7BC|nr:hypothetical protein [Mycobacterium sp. TY813]MDP7729547.1 hypothetical protein [Mycobacterium sp. TY813]